MKICKSHKECFTKVCSLCEDYEPLSSDAVLDGVRELIAMIDSIPCTCNEGYTSRRLVDPDCPRCNYIDDDIIIKLRAHVG